MPRKNQLEEQNKIKIVLLGDRAVGKSSIIKRYITSIFDQTLQPTIGVDFLKKKVWFGNKNWKLQIWDTAGQQKYRSLVKGYMKGADVCIFVYDNTNINTLTNLPEWFHIFDNVCDTESSCIIACNKIDLRVDQSTFKSKQIFRERSNDLKKYQQVRVSAKSGQNIDQLFELALLKATEKYCQRRKSLTLLKKHTETNFCCFN